MNSKRYACLIAGIPILLILAGCAPTSVFPRSNQIQPNYANLLRQAERNATSAGRRVLETGRRMTLDQRLIIPGGCWGYVDAVYNKAGYPSNLRKRVFSGRKGSPPYANTQLIQPGDWIYYSNHSYRGIEHSAIFVAWIDRSRKIALMLSYGGEGRRQPARYKAYDLRSVYRVDRPAQGMEY